MHSNSRYKEDTGGKERRARMLRISFEELKGKFESILVSRGFAEENAGKAADIMAKSAADGVYSHSVNRFPKLVSYMDKGVINPKAVPERIAAFGSFERYEGNFALGCLNAVICMDRACELAKEHGIGIVSIGHTNHWLRAGSYGWQAADKGCVGICWTNTMPNMPAWGAKDRKIGNNPVVMAIPRSDGNHVVVDCAMSQFAYGKIEEARLKNQELSVPGGYDREGHITKDPAEIEQTWRVLPIGYWKGSGLSIALDLMAAVLSGANSVTDIGRKYEEEIGLSQVFIAIDPEKFNTKEFTDSILENTLSDIHTSEPVKPGGKVYYPGERTVLTRKENMENGIPVLEDVWERICALEV